MIDWSNKDSLRRRGNKDVRAVDVHVSPGWMCTTYNYLHYVKWSDGRICGYLPDGHYISTKEHDLDVIPALRSGEGWMRLYSGFEDRFVIEPTKECDEMYIRVRWEEVVE